MTLRNNIKRILREESTKDLSPIIENLLNGMLVKPNKHIVCGVKVKHPDNRNMRQFQDVPFKDYRVDITLIGGVDSKYWPRTQSVNQLYNEIADSAWNLVYDFMGKPIDIFVNYTNECK